MSTISSSDSEIAAETIRVYVGTDRSQMLACDVLEHSIKRHTDAKVELVPMLELPIPLPQDPKNYPRTGFSFARFCIPKLAGYQGKAIYMDADMMVFKDIRSMWNLPLNGAKIMIQNEQVLRGSHGQTKKKRQCSVMLMDCGALDWDVRRIVQDLDEQKYTYGELMSELCILSDEEIATRLPDTWNHLDQYNPETCLLHFTNMHRQPWMSSLHPLAEVWFDEVRLMLANGTLTWARIQQGSIEFEPQRVRFGQLCQYVISLFSAIAQQKNITLHAEIAEGVSLRADMNMLETMLRNLIGNALKFTHPGPGEVMRVEAPLDNQLKRCLQVLRNAK